MGDEGLLRKECFVRVYVIVLVVIVGFISSFNTDTIKREKTVSVVFVHFLLWETLFLFVREVKMLGNAFIIKI